MKKIIFIAITLLNLSVYGQRNVLHDAKFWDAKPEITAIEMAISKGNHPSEAGPYGADATVYAINAQSSLPVIKFMLSQAGNGINKPVSNGRTYLFSAASKGNVALMEYLISKGAKIDVIDNFGYSVLTYAAATGQIDTNVYNICIRHGSNPKTAKIVGGANAMLLLASYAKDISLIDYFVAKGVDIKSTDSAGHGIFDYAVRNGNINILKELVVRGVKINPDAMISASIGTFASNNATLSLYKYLEELKLNPAVTNANGENALHYIARRPKQEEIISYFIAKGANVNQANNDGNTPLMNAANFNTDLPNVMMLTEAVKNINHVNKKGVSALALAVRNNTPELVQYLIDKGADVKVIDADGYNLTYYLIPAFAKQPLAFEAKLKSLQHKGFDITAIQGNGNTLYHMVLVKNGIDLLKRIEGFKVDVNIKNKEGLTPLHKAAMTATDDVILKYLISIGAKKNILTDLNETAYHLALENEFLIKNKISLDFLK